MDDIQKRIAGLSPRKQALLSKRLKERAAAPPKGRITPRADGLAPAPLSFAQQRLWFLDRLMPGTPFYNIPAAVKLTGALDLPALRASLNEVVRRHESLRTTFTSSDGEPLQVVAPALDLDAPVVDLRGVGPATRRREALRLAAEHAGLAFDLGRGPLLRVTLLRLSEDEHAVLLLMHHIVSDGWSMGVLMQELSASYAALSRGEPVPLPELEIQYPDFAIWQRGWLQGEVLDAQLDYWRRQLAGVSAVELPSDRPRPPVQSYRGAAQSFTLPGAVYEKIKSLSREEGATLFMALLAAFQALLHRHTGQTDIAVATPIAGRNVEQTEKLIGFFVNTLILRAEVAGGTTFRRLLRQVREVTLGAYANQDLPFERLVEELQPRRDLSRAPLSQVAFALENVTPPALKMPGVSLDSLWSEEAPVNAKYDLSVTMFEGADWLAGTVQYNTDLYDAETVSRLAGHFQTLVAGVAAHPDRRLSEISLLTEEERRRQVNAWSGTRTPYARDLCAHQLIERAAARSPTATAVASADGTLSYGELNRRANQLARHLVALGVGPEMRVAICLERGPDAIVSLLAVLKAGAAYLPLDPAYPKGRLAFITRDASAHVLITREPLLERLPEGAGRTLCLDAEREAIAAQDEHNLPPRARPENLAYVIYTSGSTGKPKGVSVTHGNVLHSTSARLAYYPEAVRSYLLLTSLAFDSSVAGIYWALSQGGTLVLPEEGAQRDPRGLAEIIASDRVSHLLTLPSLYGLILDSASPGQLGTLAAAIVAGEACPPELVRKHSRQCPHTSFYNEYGPTEATVWCTVYKAESDAARARLPIGKPIANAATYLLDADSNLPPVGLPAELYVGGDGVARGYLNRPALTAERFVPDPFSGEPGARLYRTGDLARHLPDGNLDFLGRLDEQVKIRGYRIELGEIESVLATHPALREAAAVMREDTPGEKSIVAYAVPRQGASPTVSELRAYLGERLPDYLVPGAYVLVEALPLTPNGKLDRRALPAPENKRPHLKEAYVAPAGATEMMVAAIWGEVLNVEQVGVDDNFFDLGGHSLLAVKVHARICESLNRDVRLLDLFQYPTVGSLARFLDAEEETRATQSERLKESRDWAERRRNSLLRQRQQLTRAQR